MADRRLQVFYTVAKQLSFTRAAELLYMTQPAVTFQVKQLEEHLNAKLFERAHGKIELTAAGAVALDYAERILALTSEMETRLGELTGQVSGPLRIGASTTIAEYMLPRLLGAFKNLYPQVQAQLTVANSESIETRVAELQLDVGLIEAPSHHPNLTTAVCCDDELVLICAPDHAFAHLPQVTPQQVVGQPYISRESGSGTREVIDDYFRQEGLVPETDLNLVMEMGSREAIKGAVEAGLGVAIVSSSAIRKELKLGDLAAVPLFPRLIRPLSVVYASGKFQSQLLQAFLGFVEQRVRNNTLR